MPGMLRGRGGKKRYEEEVEKGSEIEKIVMGRRRDENRKKAPFHFVDLDEHDSQSRM